MKGYHELIQRILDEGEEKGDRTGTGTLSVFGHQMRFDLSEGFPMVTTKKLHLRSIVHELLWFLKGDTNVKLSSHLKNLFKEEAKARASGSKLQGGNAPKSSSNRSRSGGFAASGGDASSSNSSPNALVSSGHESMHRKVIAIPLDRRPIMPGIIMPVRTFDMTLVAELEDMKKRGQAYVGAFLKKERVKESQKEDNSNTSKNGNNNNNKDTNNNGAIAGAMKEDVSGLSVGDLEYDPASELHDIGTFAQVHNIVRSQDTDPDSKDGNGATLLLLGHRRIKKVSTDRKSPVTIVNCEHLKDAVSYTHLTLPTKA